MHCCTLGLKCLYNKLSSRANSRTMSHISTSSALQQIEKKERKRCYFQKYSLICFVLFVFWRMLRKIQNKVQKWTNIHCTQAGFTAIMIHLGNYTLGWKTIKQLQGKTILMLSFSSRFFAFTGNVLTLRKLATTCVNMNLFAGDVALPGMLTDATRNHN